MARYLFDVTVDERIPVDIYERDVDGPEAIEILALRLAHSALDTSEAKRVQIVVRNPNDRMPLVTMSVNRAKPS